MSSETYSYKGISAGKYVEGSIDALSQEEASFKLKEQKIIITKLIRTKKKAADKTKKIQFGFDQDNTVRVMKGLQVDYFSKKSQEDFFSKEYKVTRLTLSLIHI